MIQWHWPLWAGLLGAICTGGLCGFFNGYVSVKCGLPSFIVTLAMMEIARGGAHAVTKSQTQYIGTPIEGFANAQIFGLSLAFLLAMLVVVAGQIVLSRAVFGRYMMAVGANPEAARLSGIAPGKIKTRVLFISGFLAALAAIIDTSRFQSANPNAGAGFELQAIAAAVIGGTSLMGGRGSVVRTFFGVLIVAVLNTGLATVGAADEIKRIATGAVIIAAVMVDHYRHRFGERSAS
jgi:ribose transport system permease protein